MPIKAVFKKLNNKHSKGKVKALICKGQSFFLLLSHHRGKLHLWIYLNHKEVLDMKNKNYYINLTERERSEIIHSLISNKNALIAQERYTDLIDDVICKLQNAEKKTFRVQTI